VLLISGRDDRMWPSTAMAELSLRRLREHGHPHAVEHLAYDSAGHLIHPPFAPTTRRYQKHGVLGTEFDYGGGPAANAHACADSWPKVLDFLGTALRTT